MKYIPYSLLGICLFFATSAVNASSGRWYNVDQVSQGEVIYLQNCAGCHGESANAIEGWEQASGEKAAPPLNGTAHTWHHSMDQLFQTIQQGSIQLGGAMPPFKEKLSEDDIKHVIAYFQSKWPEEVYQPWAAKFKVAAASEDITRLLKMRLGTYDIAPASETGIDGVYQTQLGDKYAYLIEGGRYVFIGDLIDLKRSRNITQISRQTSVKEALNKVALSNLVIFPADGEEKAILNVFTDTSCGYCQKLHKEVGYLQEAGISVHYFPFPRGGSRGPGYADLKSVWCASDRTKAMDIAKGVSLGSLAEGSCKKAAFVDEGFELGRKIGITGTPSLFSADGTKFNGYVPYDELIPMLLNKL